MSSSAASDFFAKSDRKEATGTNMAKKQPTKKQPTKTPGQTSPSKTSAYFPVPMSIQTNAELKSQFEISLSLLNATGELKLLDQSRITGQTLFNLISLWLARSLEKKGVKAVARELKPIMDELSVIVATEMRGRGREIDPVYLPEGFSLTKRRGKSKPGNPDSTDAE